MARRFSKGGLRTGAIMLLLLMTFIEPSEAASVTLAWDGNTESDLAGYKVHYGGSSGNYTNSTDVGNVTTNRVDGLMQGARYFFVVTAYNTNGLESEPSNEISYTVPAATNNTPPSLSTIADQTTNEDTARGPITFTVGDSQTPAASLTVTGSSSNTNLISGAAIAFGGSGSNRTVTLTPATNHFGSATITIFVSDGSLATNQVFLLTVNPVNDAPVISAVADQTAARNTSTAALPCTVSDVETPAANLVVSASSSNPGLLPASNIVLGGSGANRTVTLTAASNQVGNTTVTLSVNDGTVVAATTFNFSVVDAATIALEAESANLVAPMVLRTNAQASGGRYIETTIANTGTATFTVQVPFTGDYVIWCRVLAPDDGHDSFFVSADGGVEDVYDVAQNTWSSAWQWTRVNGRGGGTSAAAIDPRLFSFSAGTHTIVFRGRERTTGLDRIIVTNDRNFVPGGSPQATNTAPTISAIADQRTNEDTALAPIAFQVEDKETSAASLAVSASSSNPTLIPNANVVLSGSGTSRTVVVTPAANQFGSANITVSVSDGSLSTNDTFTVVVDPINDPPTVSTITNRSIPRNGSTGPIPFTVGDIETAAPGLTVTASSSNPSLVLDQDLVMGGSGTNRTITVTAATNQIGTATVTLVVGDGVTTVSTGFTVTVVGSSSFALEAESAALVSPMSIMLNSGASNGRYVATTKSEQGRATFTVPISTPDTYVIWCRVLAPTSSRDTFYLAVDGGTRDVFDLLPRSSSWQWRLANGRGGTGDPRAIDPRTFTLSAGTHTIVFSGRERWAGLDRIIVTNDRTFVPTDPLPNGGPIPFDDDLRVGVSALGNELMLTWDANEGSTYQVVYKESFEDPDWILVAGFVEGTADTAISTALPIESGSRYYRLLRIR